MSAYERFQDEQWPTGTFGHALPPPEPEPPSRPIPHWTPEEQAQHYTDLCEALDGWHWDEDPRHLRVVAEPGETNAA